MRRRRIVFISSGAGGYYRIASDMIRGRRSFGSMRRMLEVLLVSSLALFAVAQQAVETQPTYTLRGKFIDTDNNTYRSLPFTVPAGTHRITIVFSHTQAEKRTVIDLGLYDP